MGDSAREEAEAASRAGIEAPIDLPPEAIATARVLTRAARVVCATLPFGAEPPDFLVVLDQEAETRADPRP